MRSGGSLLLPLWGILAVWSPLLPVSGDFESRCTPVPNDTERCGEPTFRFFYNVTSKACVFFTYYGCPGNLNIYERLEECMRFCHQKEAPAKRKKRTVVNIRNWKSRYTERKIHHYHREEWSRKKIQH